jgi:adenine-specific DNA-methyltransferase
MQAQDLVKRVSALDPALGKDLQNYLGTRRLGLVWEESKPEYVRLWNKPVIEGDLVNILPPRSEAENLTDDSDEHDAIWRVAKIIGDTARLVGFEGDAMCDASVDDLVPVARFDQRIYCGLKETGRVERGGDKPYQTVINGENFHAIESLLFAYRGKVDCIYIDPPYNTGAKDWKYNNNYVSSDDRYRHSKWLTFMEDRLKVAKALLNPENSVLICTIDEKEVNRLGLLLEWLFPEAINRQLITCVTNPSGSSRASAFARAGEYIFVLMFGDAHITRRYTDMLHDEVDTKDIAWEGYIRRGATRLRSNRPNMFYPIFFSEKDGSFAGFGDVVPIGVDYKTVPVPKGCFAVWPVVGAEERYWRLAKESSEKIYEQGFLKFGPWKKGQRKRAVYYLPSGTRQLVKEGAIEVLGRNSDGTLELAPVKKKVMPLDIWNKPSHSAADYGTPLLGHLIPGRKFPFPKSLYAVEDTIRFFVADKPDALIVDFFAGSGTTAHAVMRLNHQDGGHRRCICVTNNEVSADEQKALVAKGLRQGDAEWERLGICEYVTKPRVTAAITGNTPDGEPIKVDYKFADEFPMADGFEENAVYYDLTYLEPAVVSADLAFDEIAPLLWLRAGSVGPVIHHGDTYELTDAYGVLFDTDYAAPFIRACEERRVPLVFVVTDVDADYRALNRDLPGAEVVQLYKQYLRSFEIGAGL